jgi:hypothetical protein
MEQSAPHRRHAFSHAPAALRIFRFAADSAPRVLQLARVSAFLRECAVEFGSADATLPGALRIEYAKGRYFRLCSIVLENTESCPWLAEKLLACRSGAPIPAAALAPDVTRHDVKWGAEGARRRDKLHPTHGGYGLALEVPFADSWAQGPVGVTSGKHFFQVSVTAPGRVNLAFVGWLDDKVSLTETDWVGSPSTQASGAAYYVGGRIWFGTAPLTAPSSSDAPANKRPCVVGCLLDLDATPARMTVFVDGVPLAAQCEYDFPKDGRAWFPSVCVSEVSTALHSCAI